MSYAFRPDDRSVQAGFRRIARAELGDALKRLGGALPDAEAVHGLRKHTKKLRGLIRLVRPVFPDFDTVNATLRDGARRLAPLRDAEVRLATLRGLAADLPGGLPEGVEDRLVAEVEALRAGADLPAELARLAADLATLRHAARSWRLQGRGWGALAPGLGTTWRRARRGLRQAQDALGRDAAPFHAWRTAVKHHWYQARLLTPLWPALMDPWIAQVDALGEGLGRHNDLDVLRAHLAALDDPALARLATEGPLAEALEVRMRAEGEAALVLGARLLADRPQALVRRWGVWWHLWAGQA
jgi:CHAD domain-containing protein